MRINFSFILLIIINFDNTDEILQNLNPLLSNSKDSKILFYRLIISIFY
jgi:hypothetical protein